MSAYILLNLLYKFWEKIRCEALPSILSFCPNVFNKFTNTGARMQDSIYPMTLNLHLIQDFRIDTSSFYH